MVWYDPMGYPHHGSPPDNLVWYDADGNPHRGHPKKYMLIEVDDDEYEDY